MPIEPSIVAAAWGLVAVGLAVLWAAACLWIERDAADVLGRSFPWKLPCVLSGTLLFIALLLWGTAAVPWFLFLMPAGLLGFVLYRDSKAMAQERLLLQLFSRQFWQERWRAARRSPLASLFRRRGENDVLAGVSDRSDQVILLKKDGSGIDGTRGADRETSQAVSTLQEIFLSAIDRRATDIHFEPKEGGGFQLRLRIDGILHNTAVIPADRGRPALSAAKVLADMDIAERRRPQDGTFSARCNSRVFEVRAASGPTNFGEKISLRLLDADGGIVKAGLERVGMEPTMLGSLRSIIHRPHGMLLVCGPTGSGKTTTVYAALSEIDVLTRNIITIEDPIEYQLENISQTAVNNAADLTFANILRSTLRQDPDVILVGEIRDKETAEIAMQAALTGHFVFSTLHANDSATTVTRLLDIGIDASLMQSAITAVLSQRLVRVLCQKCREPYEPVAELKAKCGLQLNEEVVFYRSKGCKACHDTGFRGRTGIYELLVFTPPIRQLLVGRPSIEAIRGAARKAGVRSLRHAGIRKVVEGVTTVSEVARVTSS
jgi:general secretion pathway protein E